jgi:acyl-CoA synthetase (NDP forming)
MRMTLRAALHPKSVAVLGASDNPDKIGGRPILFMRQCGYSGAVYPINPNREVVQGYRAYPSLDSLPEAPDVAIVAVAGAAAIEAVNACARLGVKVCIVLASGFGEMRTNEGPAQQAAMAQVARQAGMRMIGPNCQGLANFANGAILGFSTMFIESPPQDGPVGIVSQSGGMSGVIYAGMRSRGHGVRYVNATGNDAEVTTIALAIEMAADPDLKVLMVYAEGVKDLAMLGELGAVAHARRLPVVMLKAGRTAAGATAARAHTGAQANDDAAIEAALAEARIWRAPDLTSLLGVADLHLRGWRGSGRRVAVVSNSGASCVTATDALYDHGLELAVLDPGTRDRLAMVLPPFASVANPVDLTAALLSNSALFGQILPILGEDPAADAFLLAVPVAGAGYDVEAFGRDAAAFAAQTGKPVVIAANLPKVAAEFRGAGLPVFPYETEAVAALAQFLSHQALMDAAPRS